MSEPVLRIERAVAQEESATSESTSQPAAVEEEQAENQESDAKASDSSKDEEESQGDDEVAADEQAETLSFSGVILNKSNKMPIKGATVVNTG